MNRSAPNFPLGGHLTGGFHWDPLPFGDSQKGPGGAQKTSGAVFLLGGDPTHSLFWDPTFWGSNFSGLQLLRGFPSPGSVFPSSEPPPAALSPGSTRCGARGWRPCPWARWPLCSARGAWRPLSADRSPAPGDRGPIEVKGSQLRNRSIPL